MGINSKAVIAGLLSAISKCHFPFFFVSVGQKKKI